ncbi:heme exporter protein CcmD [Endozoicomonadaceae bacterium StTr2]
MAFEDFASFIAMGGHGLYVWTSYAVAALVVIFNLVGPWREKRRISASISRQMRRETAAPKAKPVQRSAPMKPAHGESV